MRMMLPSSSPILNIQCQLSKHIQCSRKFLLGENFHKFHHLVFSLVKILSAIFLSCVNDYIEDIANFTTLVKIYSTEYFCNTKVAGLGEINF